MNLKIVWMLFIVAISSILIGCADSHFISHKEVQLINKLMPSDTVYIAKSRNGRYKAKPYEDSAEITQKIVFSAFAKHTNALELGENIESISDALLSAKQKNQKYLVFPMILHWEDRATEWSAIPDKVEVKLEVIEVSSKKSASAIIHGSSGLATLGGDHPQDLLPEPIEAFVEELY